MDLIRSVLYPMIPILAVIVVWAFAYANSLESKVQRELGPLEDRPYAYNLSTHRSAGARPMDRSVAADHVSAVDDGN